MTPEGPPTTTQPLPATASPAPPPSQALPGLRWILTVPDETVHRGAALAALVAVAGWAFGAPAGSGVWPLVSVLAALAGLAAGWSAVHRGHEARRQRSTARALRALGRQHDEAEAMAGIGLWRQHVDVDRLELSDGAFRIFGLDAKAGAPTPQEFIAGIHPEDLPRWEDAHGRVLTRAQEVRIEYRYRRTDRVVWIRSTLRPERDAAGRVVRMGGVVQDISGIRAMQQQLAASEAKFRDLTHMSSDWVWETDTHHRLATVSGPIDAVLGPWARAAVGKPAWEAPVRTYLKSDPDAVRTAFTARKPFEALEYSLLDPEGRVFHVAISGRPIFDDAGQFRGFRGVGRNITRERNQRLLLEIDGEVAAIMREQNEPERVITAIVITICGQFGWSGGAHLVRTAPKTYSVRERWGYPAFTRMISELPEHVPLDDEAVETIAFNSGKAIWLQSISTQPEFARRMQAERLGVRTAFLAPILDENKRVLSVLMFLGPVAFKGDAFLTEAADILSRTLSLYLQRKAAERRLMHGSLHDALTGLPNRVNLTHQLETRLKSDEPAAVLYVDLDRYKIINDTLGHSVGDQVLIEVARRMRESIRPGDVAGRIGGDEFIVLLAGTDDRAEIEAIARALLAAIEKPFVLNNRAYFLSASIGVAVAPHDGIDANVLVKSADAAMYRVKSEGRNDVRFFTGSMSDERSEQLQLSAELPLAMQRGEIDLHYQPILDIGTRTVVGVEALLRWRHPTRGLLLPERFLPMAEQSNLIREIGMWAIRRALDDRVQLGLAEYPNAAVSVNVSARQLAEEGFLATLNAMLVERNFPPGLLRLEVTESAFIENPERTIALIGELRRLGVRVIIDNFGTGYASLSYLKNLPVDGVKIDRTFVRDLPEDRGNAAIVQAVTTLTARLGLKAMAEGVETAAELKALRSFECEQMQGTVISEPLPFVRLHDFMETLPALRQMHLVRELP